MGVGLLYNLYLKSAFRRFDGRRWLKVGEAVSVAAMSALTFITLIYAVPDCHPIRGFNSTGNHPSALHDVIEATVTSGSSSGLPVGNSTDDDVMGAHDVTQATREMTSVRERAKNTQVLEHDSYGYHGGHGYVFQVRSTCSLSLRQTNYLLASVTAIHDGYG